MAGRFPAKPQSGLPREYPFRLAASRQSTFPKGTASVVAAKFPASPKGVPLGELSPQATEGVAPRSAALPQEAGAANTACRHDPTREKGVLKSPQAFQNPQN